jgi:type IV secretion system protein TrbB
MHHTYLHQKLGSTLQHALDDPKITEIILNPDGQLWFHYHGEGYQPAGTMDEAQANNFVHALAEFHQCYLNDETPFFDVTLPFHGERVNVTIPPITERVSFNIRKHSKIIFTLDDYVNAQVMTAAQRDVLIAAIKARKNILVSGSPASGKTTLTNALLHALAELAPPGHRVLLLEQVPELQCRLPNAKVMQTTDNVSMNKLLWLAMRNSPERIIIGEVRDGAALDLLKAWNTGCAGGIATIHANHAKAAMQRVIDLACEATATPPYTLAAEAIDLIVHIEARRSAFAGRVVTELVTVAGFDRAQQQFIFHP